MITESRDERYSTDSCAVLWGNWEATPPRLGWAWRRAFESGCAYLARLPRV